MNTTNADQSVIAGTHLEGAVTASHRAEPSRSARRFTPRLVAGITILPFFVGGVVITGCAFGVAGAVTVPAEQKPSYTAEVDAERAALVRWAKDNDVAGRSPASVSRQATPEDAQLAVERAQIVAWAHTQGLSGLSPASMRPTGG